ncbi:hypothetical protein U0023_25530 (plasmid) [Microvirga lotononidis]|uniref:Uncharacterized protein n=2 Tax=Microvirga lotononidis TaxID=864069 RepID=I4YR28_9HYPH|nr:hypothetical protein [Microvirga lotononidis]EIM26420.1 hypothetical protein MicloDRAFT_00029690 [Microvirga lotononidis]WQO30782.1 hypothetical protein U0023_25530 [Microvirga lotononidis]
MNVALNLDLRENHLLRKLMRPASELMTPDRLAAIQPSRISASRALMNQAIRERWKIECRRFEIDERARGTALYIIDTGNYLFSFPVYSFEPSPEGRTGRIIGRAWDMMGALIEGEITSEDLETTRRELPKLYEGRATPGTLTWCRSNRSARFFDFALDALASGRQPDVAPLGKTCYLMRNTGLDGNGTFGTRTFLTLEADHPLRWSLSAQMLSAYMMRVFAEDLLNHLARLRSPEAVSMAPELARYLGVGNGSALGLMLFVNNHPRLIDRWIFIREEALAHAKMLVPQPDGKEVDDLIALLRKAIRFRREDRVVYEAFTKSDIVADNLEIALREAEDLRSRYARREAVAALPFAELCETLQGRIHDEALETLHSLLIELVPVVADRLVQTLIVDEEPTLRPEMTVRRLRDIVQNDYAWAFNLDLVSERSQRYVWYKSQTAEEPRRGPREEVGDVVNLGLDLPRLIVRLDADLSTADPAMSVARFLLANPSHRAIVTRAQALAGLPYHSVHSDIMSEDFVPAHITRLLNVGIHGIDKARDFLNRNLRGVLFHGAPTAHDLANGDGDTQWFYPAEPAI